jgi:hypothetical protein
MYTWWWRFLIWKVRKCVTNTDNTNYTQFRQRLDAALRTLDVERVREFLIGEGQWSEDVPADPEFAMWMMVAGSPALQDLHAQAQKWLVGHGHEAEAQAVLGRSKDKGSAGKKKTGGQSRGKKNNAGAARAPLSAEQRFRAQQPSRRPNSK